MLKIPFIKIFLSFALVLGLLGYAPSAGAAALDVVPEQTPLFNDANFYPGSSVARTVDVTNNTAAAVDFGVRSLNIDDSDGLGGAINLVITQTGVGTLFSGTFAEFFIASAEPGALSLSVIAPAGSVEYVFSAEFDPDADNGMQGKNLGFDLVFGVISEAEEEPETKSVTGTKFNDHNGDGGRNDGDEGLSGWTIYVDLNNNSIFDDGEPSDITDSEGVYVIGGLTPTSTAYIIREVPQSGWTQTHPRADLYPQFSDYHSVVISETDEGVVGYFDFGNQVTENGDGPMQTFGSTGGGGGGGGPPFYNPNAPGIPGPGDEQGEVAGEQTGSTTTTTTTPPSGSSDGSGGPPPVSGRVAGETVFIPAETINQAAAGGEEKLSEVLGKAAAGGEACTAFAWWPVVYLILTLILLILAWVYRRMALSVRAALFIAFYIIGVLVWYFEPCGLRVWYWPVAVFAALVIIWFLTLPERESGGDSPQGAA